MMKSILIVCIGLLSNMFLFAQNTEKIKLNDLVKEESNKEEKVLLNEVEKQKELATQELLKQEQKILNSVNEESSAEGDLNLERVQKMDDELKQAVEQIKREESLKEEQEQVKVE